ncbi:MAG: hypothetical protein HC786_29880 [Richelia sp. CSU_2_1]|nr:hypothetical protein [Richelia sp. CSU_2_1]
MFAHNFAPNCNIISGRSIDLNIPIGRGFKIVNSWQKCLKNPPLQKLSLINSPRYQLSTVNYQLSTVNCQLSTIFPISAPYFQLR